MSAPFRDELATAHATISRLEAEIRELRAKLDHSRPPSVSRKTSLMRLLTIFLLCLMGALLMLGIGAGGWKMKQANSGVAMAPRANIPSTVDPGNAAPAEPASPDEQVVH